MVSKFQLREKELSLILLAARFKPWTAGRKAWTLPLCYTILSNFFVPLACHDLILDGFDQQCYARPPTILSRFVSTAEKNSTSISSQMGKIQKSFHQSFSWDSIRKFSEKYSARKTSVCSLPPFLKNPFGFCSERKAVLGKSTNLETQSRRKYSRN